MQSGCGRLSARAGYRVNVMESGYSAQLLDVYRRGPGYRDEILDIVN